MRLKQQREKGKAITEYGAMNSSAGKRYILYTYTFVFLVFFCAFLVSYITSDFSPVKRITNRFMCDIWVYCYISASFLHFRRLFHERKKKNRLILNGVPLEFLSVSKSFVHFRLYISKLGGLPYCFRSFGRNFTLRWSISV